MIVRVLRRNFLKGFGINMFIIVDIKWKLLGKASTKKGLKQKINSLNVNYVEIYIVKSNYNKIGDSINCSGLKQYFS